MAGQEGINDSKKNNWIATFFPNRREDGTYDENFDFCNWRIPEPQNYGEFFRCFIHQHEIGGNTERDHIQAFISCRDRRRFNQITARCGLEPYQVHYKPCWRTPDKAWDYCSERKGQHEQGQDGGTGEAEDEEDGTRCGCPSFSFGQRPERRGGQRSNSGRRGVDWLAIRDLAGSGLPERFVLQSDECVGLIRGHFQYYRWAKSVLTAPQNTPDEWSQRSVFVYWGPTGAGKSKRVREECARFGLPLWVAPVGALGAWYDGFDGHFAALFDDFTGGMPLRDLLNLLEGNKVRVQVKGSFVTFGPSVVFFTSDRPWQQWLFPKGPDRGLGPLSPEEEAQLGRRITYQEEVRSPIQVAQALGMPHIITNPISLGVGDNTETPTPSSPDVSDVDVRILFPELFDD